LAHHHRARLRQRAGFILTRQSIPVLEGTNSQGVTKDGYVLGGGNPADADVIIIATGSELQLAVAATKLLAHKDINAYVVSMPCVEWFESQPKDHSMRAGTGGEGSSG
jgi:transketolase